MRITIKTNLVLCAMVYFLGTLSFAAANPFDDASAAYARGDYVQALKLFRQLAESGHQWAQRRVGSMYAEGKGVAQDYQEAIKWYRLAAAQGNTPAQYSLGLTFEKGLGVPQDYRQALSWYRIAAAREDEWAQMRLGSMYAKGRGVTQDFVRAYMWFDLAVAEASGDSAAKAKKKQDKIAAKLTAEQIATAQQIARRCQQSSFRNCD